MSLQLFNVFFVPVVYDIRIVPHLADNKDKVRHSMFFSEERVVVKQVVLSCAR